MGVLQGHQVDQVAGERQVAGETDLDVAAAFLEEDRKLPLDHDQKIVTTEAELGKVLKTPEEAISEQVDLESGPARV